PLFTAWGRRSSATASSCASTSGSATAVQSRTPTVFCAVIAVMTLVPNTPKRWKVLRSAWMPAPPPESEPGMVSAIRMNERCAAQGRGACDEGGVEGSYRADVNFPSPNVRCPALPCGRQLAHASLEVLEGLRITLKIVQNRFVVPADDRAC